MDKEFEQTFLQRLYKMANMFIKIHKKLNITNH